MRNGIYIVIFLLVQLITTGDLLAADRQSAITEIQRLQKNNRQKIRSIDLKTKDAIHKIQKDLNKNTIESIKILQVDIRHIRLQKKELLARQSFYDQLIFSLDQKYKTGSLHAFVRTTILAMVVTEVQSSGESSSIWQFLTYLVSALDSLPRASGNTLSFIEGYMNYSSILNPIHPKQYLALMDYTDGHYFHSASKTNPTTLGEIVEQQLTRSTMTYPSTSRQYLLEAPTLKSVEMLKVTQPLTKPTIPKQNDTLAK